MGGKVWTDSEVRTLRYHMKMGFSMYEISDVIKSRSYISIKHKASRLNIRSSYNSKIDPVKRAALLDYLVENPGSTLSQASRFLNRNPQSTGSLSKHLLREGLLIRMGTETTSVRFIVTIKWFSGKGRGVKELYAKYIKSCREAVPQMFAMSEQIPDYSKN